MRKLTERNNCSSCFFHYCRVENTGPLRDTCGLPKSESDSHFLCCETRSNGEGVSLHVRPRIEIAAKPDYQGFPPLQCQWERNARSAGGGWNGFESQCKQHVRKPTLEHSVSYNNALGFQASQIRNLSAQTIRTHPLLRGHRGVNQLNLTLLWASCNDSKNATSTNLSQLRRRTRHVLHCVITTTVELEQTGNHKCHRHLTKKNNIKLPDTSARMSNSLQRLVHEAQPDFQRTHTCTYIY